MNFIVTLIRAHASALTLRATANPSRAQNLWLGALHFIGWVALARVLNLSVAEILFFALVLLAPFVVTRANLWTLAPWFFVYPFIALRFVLTRIFNAPLPSYFDDAIINPLSALVFLPALSVAAYVYQLLIAILSARKPRAIAFSLAFFSLAALGWASAEFIGHRTRGVTGSDPYAYVQMGIDFAARGTFLHRFDLFSDALTTNVAWYPIVHVGYHLPLDAAGDAPTVWSPFGSLLYALAYRLAGQDALYWVNPLVTILAALATSWLAWESTRTRGKVFRASVAALAGAIIISSNQQSVWARVPMVDAQAELFTTLAFLFGAKQFLDQRYQRSDMLTTPSEISSMVLGIGSPLLAGILLGLAYDVRHTQVLLAPAFILLVALTSRPRRDKLGALILIGLGALLAALPDLWYHQTVFGNFLTPESNELALFAPNAILTSASNIADLFTRGNEFGWLIPLLTFGAWEFGKRERRIFWACAAWVLVLLAFHLPYVALRLRDLIPEFPPLAFLSALGFVALVARAHQSETTWKKFAFAFLIFLALDLLALRVWYTVGRPWREPLGVFGYLTTEQRAAFDEIARLTPPNAVIGAGFNTGALDLYSHRAAIHPADWTSAERVKFFCALQKDGRGIYLLDDSTEMEKLLGDDDWKSELVARLNVPIFDPSEVGQTVLSQAGTFWKVELDCQ